jgi:hypothetical protein
VQQKDFDFIILPKSLRPHLKLSHRCLDGNAGNGGAIGGPRGLIVGGFLGDVLAGCRQGQRHQTQQGDQQVFGAMLGFHGLCNNMSENVNANESSVSKANDWDDNFL